jgi:hypothetical protein
MIGAKLSSLMYPSHPTFDDLLTKLYGAAKLYHQEGAAYYSTIVNRPKDKSKAAQPYRDAGNAYLAILFTCQQYLLSIERDESLEKELERIQTLFRSVQATQVNL